VREVLEREARKEKSDKDKTADKREDEEKGDVRDVNEKGDLKQSEEKDGKEGSGSESEENGNSKSIIKNALLREPISPLKESGKSSKSVKRKTNDDNTGAPTKRVRRSLNLEEALGDENLLEEDKLVLQNKDERDEDDISDASGLLKSSDEELKEPGSPNSACTSVVGSDDTHVSSLGKDGHAGSDA
uniref:Uncharacterized protein n=1 Tax=Ciona savignyi TaxID=51511 RepID=H2Y5N5_CIOSA